MADNMPGVLIADDDADFRAIASDYLNYHGFRVLVAGNGGQAVTLAEAHAIDIAILDVVMPELSGVDLIPRLKEFWPDVVIILLTAYATVSQAVETIQLGAFDYLEKPIPLPRLHELVKRAWQIKQVQGAPLNQLSLREREVLQRLAEGRSDPEIAQALCLSPYTVNTHVRNILTKLNVENRLQAALVWDRWNRQRGQ
jgi:DNA-binding NarL/FixJ family response regulator